MTETDQLENTADSATPIDGETPARVDSSESYSTGELPTRSTIGVLWSGLGMALSTPIGLLASIILARILTPGDFGLMTMVTALLGLATVLNDFGLGPALVQRKSLQDGEIQSIFWLNMLIGFLMFGLGAAAAPAIAAFYGQPRLAPIVVVMSMVFIVSSLQLVPQSLLLRRISLRRISLAGVIAALVAAVVSISAALLGLGVWSLVTGSVASAVASMLVVASGVDWRPRLHFRWSETRHMVGFAGLVTVASFLTYGAQNIDYVLSGRFLGQAALGIYALAFNLMAFPARQVSQLVARAAMPGFSAIQDQPERLRRAYLAIISYSAVVVGPLLVTAAVLSRELVLSLYGARWTSAIGPFAIMCIAGYVYAVTTLVGLVLRPLRRADLETAYAAASLVAVSAGVALGLPFGVLGVAVGVTAANLVVRLPMALHANRLIGARVSMMMTALLPSLVASAIAGATASAFRWPLVAVRAPVPVTLLIAGTAAMLAAWGITRASRFGQPVHEVERLVRNALAARRRGTPPAANVQPAGSESEPPAKITADRGPVVGSSEREPTQNGTTTLPLSGRRVCVLVAVDVINDARVLKEARSLQSAGADVQIAGMAAQSRDETIAGIPVRLLARPWTERASGVVASPVIVVRQIALHLRLLQLVLNTTADTYHCHEIYTLPLGMLASLLTGAPFVYDAHELYTETPSCSGAKAWAWRLLERLAYHRAGLVIAANSERATVMHEEHGAPELPLVVRNVPPLMRDRIGACPEAQEARQDSGAERLLLYQGALGGSRGLEAVIDGMRLLPSAYHLALMGVGTASQAVASSLDAADPGRVHIWPTVAPDQLPRWAAVADAGVVTYAPNCRNNVLCAPNKLYDYAAAGIPLVAADLCGLRSEVERFGAGVVFTPCDAASFAKAVSALFSDHAAIDRAREGARNMHCATPWEDEESRLIEAYTHLLERTK